MPVYHFCNSPIIKGIWIIPLAAQIHLVASVFDSPGLDNHRNSITNILFSTKHIENTKLMTKWVAHQSWSCIKSWYSLNLIKSCSPGPCNHKTDLAKCLGPTSTSTKISLKRSRNEERGKRCFWSPKKRQFTLETIFC